jgi:hypothetical protein
MNRNAPTASVFTSPDNLAFKGVVSERLCVSRTQRKYETSKFINFTKHAFMKHCFCEHDRPARWYVYTDATEVSPVGGGITVLGASSLSTPLQSPTLRCQRAQGKRESWRRTIYVTSFRGLIIAVRFIFGWTVSCERTFNDITLSDYFDLKTCSTIYFHVYKSHFKLFRTVLYIYIYFK